MATAASAGSPGAARDVRFELTLGVPIPIMLEAMPVDMRNLGVSCQPLS